MKKWIFCIFLFCLFPLTGCQKDPAPLPETGDTSRAPYFSETHSLDHQAPYVLCSATVEQVLEHRYQAIGYDCLVFLATVEEIFGIGTGTAPWFDTGDKITVWVDISDLHPYTDQSPEELEAAVDTLRQIIGSSDSLILYGMCNEVIIVQDSPEHDLWLADIPESAPQYVPWDTGEFRLDLPPALKITGIRGWNILPIRGGILDGSPLEDLILSLGSEMYFSLDTPLPRGGQHFQNGDSAQDVFAAMRRYVKQRP